MLSYLAGKAFRSVLTVLAVLVITFVAARISGNPFQFLYDDGLTAEEQAALDQEFGLDRPWPAQFASYVGQIARGNFGRSISQRRPVVHLYAEAIGPTLRLAALSFLATIVVGLPLGLTAALARHSPLGVGAMAIAFIGYAVPHFLLAILMILIFSFYLNWLPSIGSETWWHYIMPTVTLSAGLIAAIARYLRGEMLGVLTQDFVRTARAKGLPESMVIGKHAVRNALIPVITVLGLKFNGLVSGSLIVETVFSFQGIGQIFIGSVQLRDYPVLQFGVIAFALTVVIVNFLVDALYAVVDPRVRRSG
ncbi:MAG: ABC transporter permease [Alphaproteobacteria bacterium]|nr:ABC transporter permease [Alphaproteobacteria bacterium]